MSEPYSGPPFDAVRKCLANLVTNGVRPFNVAEHGGELVGLEIVASRIQPVADATDVTARAIADAAALTEVLTEAAATIASFKSRQILRYVLPLQEEFLQASVKDRRAAAGENILDGRTVEPGTVRTYYEPKALDRLAAVLVQMEAEHRGQVPPAIEADIS